MSCGIEGTRVIPYKPLLDEAIKLAQHKPATCLILQRPQCQAYLMEGRDHGGPLVARSTVMGVLVAGLTTIVGFGSLLMADHRGIFGLGLLLTLGTVASLVASLVVLPVLLRMVQQMRDARRARRDAPAAAEAPAADETTERVGQRE